MYPKKEMIAHFKSDDPDFFPGDTITAWVPKEPSLLEKITSDIGKGIRKGVGMIHQIPEQLVKQKNKAPIYSKPIYYTTKLGTAALTIAGYYTAAKCGYEWSLAMPAISNTGSLSDIIGISDVL